MIGRGVLILAVAVELYDLSLVWLGVKVSNKEPSKFVGLVVRELVYILCLYFQLYFLLADFETLAKAFPAGGLRRVKPMR